MTLREQLSGLYRKFAALRHPLPLGYHRITVVTAVDAAGSGLDRTLRSVQRQDYPSRLVSHVIVDPRESASVREQVDGFARSGVGPGIRIVQRGPETSDGLRIELSAGQTFIDRLGLADANAKAQPDLNRAPVRGPTVSVVMPAYNEARFVETAITSVLRQTYDRFELIVVDDGSTDATPVILERLAAQDGRIRVLRQDNRGVVGALNRGLAAATGPYVARMDANDVVPPHRLQKQVGYLECFSDVDIVGAWMSAMSESGEPRPKVWQTPTLPGAVGWALHFSTAIVHAAIVGRLSVLRHANYYRIDGVEHLEDYDLWARLLPTVRMASLPEVLYERREVGSGITFSQQSSQQAGSRRVVHRLAAELVGGPLDEADTGALFDLHRGRLSSAVNAKALHRLLLTLHTLFVSRYAPAPAERELISYDLAKKLVRLAQHSLPSDPAFAAQLTSEAIARSPSTLAVRAVRSASRRWRRSPSRQ